MFREIKAEALTFNPFTKIGREWMLITAGDKTGYNTMTASWGAMGVMWNKNVVTVYLRPQRYTKRFIDRCDTFTVAFFGEDYRRALQICGTKSGRDGDKVAEAGLTPLFLDGTTAFEEADLILVCRKQYHQEMTAQGYDVPETAAQNYPDGDYHTLYMGSIEKVLVRA